MTSSSPNRLGRNPFQKNQRTSLDQKTTTQPKKSVTRRTSNKKKSDPSTPLHTNFKPAWLEKAYLGVHLGKEVTKIVFDVARAAIFKA